MGVSVDTPEASTELRQDLGLDFPVLADTSRETLRSYDLLNRRERQGIAIPATFVVDREGTIVFRSVDRMHSRVRPDSLIGFLKAYADDPSTRIERGEQGFVIPSLGDTLAGLFWKHLGRK